MNESNAQSIQWPAWPVIPAEGIEAVSRVLSSGKINYWTGTECKSFEHEYAAYVGVPYALAVANGTLALELALAAFEVGPGDEVIVPSRTFIATAGAVVRVGAVPIIADIDPSTNNLTALSVAQVLTPRTKAIICVHLGGYPVDMDPLISLAEQVGAVIIEDCAQAHGATYKGRAIGSLGDAGCFSFCQDKILPLGEGGLITFKDEAAYKRAWAQRDHGRSFDRAHDSSVGSNSPEFKYLTDRFGTNARLGEMEGALGRIMLDHLDEYHAQRTANANHLARAFEDIRGIRALVPSASDSASGTNHAFYRLYARIDVGMLESDWSRNRVITEVNRRGVPCQYGSSALIGKERAFQRFADVNRAPLDGAHVADGESIVFYVHPTLGRWHMSMAADVVSAVLLEAMSDE